jgi:hypothetical protein
MTSIMIYWHAENQRKLEIALPSVNEWNESEYGMIVSGVSEFMNIFGDISLTGSVRVTAYPLLAADNQSVRYDLLVYRTLHFEEEMMIYESFTQHSPILYM